MKWLLDARSVGLYLIWPMKMKLMSGITDMIVRQLSFPLSNRARKEYEMDYATWYEAFVSGPEDRKSIEAPVTD